MNQRQFRTMQHGESPPPDQDESVTGTRTGVDDPAATTTDSRSNPQPEASSANTSSNTWLDRLAAPLESSAERAESSLRTGLSTDFLQEKLSLFVPPDMPSLQPASLRWLVRFAKIHGIRLVEDRRNCDVLPLHERRSDNAAQVTRGLATLLRDTGMPGKPRTVSTPNRLAAGNAAISLPRLIKAASHAYGDSKKITVRANPLLEPVLRDVEQPIRGFGCRLLTSQTTTILSHFNAPGFHAFGYSTGNQYVIHVVLAGGRLEESELYCTKEALRHYSIGFDLYQGKTPEDDFGLMYASFFLELRERPHPWWFKAMSAQVPDTLLQTG